ncbi:MAG: peptidylprolyl isomerase [Verrucomicrobiae bacterium]|nr:peptidylprolyl isomerase [Verrucomicrobiae bacterium]MCP5540094.1 peptidylprolyl isomerase [Akkermansiaceae bacterium]
MPDSTIQKDVVAAIHYTLRNDAGETLDSSEGGEPLEYLHGHGNLVSGLEDALAGKGPGDSLSVAVAPEEGYGVFDESLISEVPRQYLPVDEIEAGMRFSAEMNEGGGRRLFTVTEVGEENVTLDGNHPLAGKTLHFEVSVTAVRDATEDEIAHGHVHSGCCGGHC